MTIKPGVRVLGIKPEALVALMVAESVYRTMGHEMTVTSVVDGQHSRGSIHYSGMAFDLRINDMPKERAQSARDALSKQLGGDYDVILEGDHIHVEFQPKDAL